MRSLAISIIVFVFSSQAFGFNPKAFEGSYVKKDEESCAVEVSANFDDLVIYYGTECWNSTIAGNAYQYVCDGSSCVNDNVGNFSDVLTPLETGNLLIEWKLKGNDGASGSLLLVRSVQGASNTKWSGGSVVINGQEIHVAQVDNQKEEANLRLQCTAGTSNIEMSLALKDLVWRAIAYSVQLGGEQLVAQMVVGGTIFDLNQWQVIDNNLVVRVGATTADEINRLKKGSLVEFKFAGVTAQGRTELASVQFSLKGSSKAISGLEGSCLP